METALTDPQDDEKCFFSLFFSLSRRRQLLPLGHCVCVCVWREWRKGGDQSPPC